eukprot:2919178-Alexandrium_andersonii.AAC.1
MTPLKDQTEEDPRPGFGNELALPFVRQGRHEGRAATKWRHRPEPLLPTPPFPSRLALRLLAD